MGSSDIVLRTPRLVLREFREDDVQAMRRVDADPEVKRYLPSEVLTEVETSAAIRWYIEQAREEPRTFYDLAITCSETPETAFEAVGWCRLAHRHDEVRQGEIAYLLRRDLWGRGFATEVAARLLEFGFGTLELHRVFATCRPANVASWRVLERVGMRREGFLKQHRWMKGAWHDSYLYAVLEDEWRGATKPWGLWCA